MTYRLVLHQRLNTRVDLAFDAESWRDNILLDIQESRDGEFRLFVGQPGSELGIFLRDVSSKRTRETRIDLLAVSQQ
jgi:hypothetical protein